MSVKDYITARNLTLRAAAEPENRAIAEAYIKYEGSRAARQGFQRLIGEAAK